jgi:hypothetical protein
VSSAFTISSAIPQPDTSPCSFIPKQTLDLINANACRGCSAALVPAPASSCCHVAPARRSWASTLRLAFKRARWSCAPTSSLSGSGPTSSKCGLRLTNAASWLCAPALNLLLSSTFVPDPQN